ncbi:hypothetical protein ACVV2G_00135 [Streptomyces ziwulingensis]
MLDHMEIQVADPEKSAAFYDAVLAPLDAPVVVSSTDSVSATGPGAPSSGSVRLSDRHRPHARHTSASRRPAVEYIDTQHTNGVFPA